MFYRDEAYIIVVGASLQTVITIALDGLFFLEIPSRGNADNRNLALVEQMRMSIFALLYNNLKDQGK